MKKFSCKKAKELKKKCLIIKKGITCFTLRWKTLSKYKSKKKVEKLPAIVSFEGITQLFVVFKLESGARKQQANTLFDIINEWDE